MDEQPKPKVKSIDERLKELAAEDKVCAVVRFLLVPIGGDAIDVTSEYPSDDLNTQAAYRRLIVAAMAKEQTGL